GRFLLLRGLSQRYNSVQINNINAPSTEVDRRSFSFDLIPSNMLDKIAIYKSPSGELAGDFAGGVIKLYTKSTIENDFLTYSLGFGYRLNTTFTTHTNNSVGSTTDYLGFDNGNRALPSSFPSSLADFGTNQNIQFGKTLNNNFKTTQLNTPMDFGLGVAFGFNFKLGKNTTAFTTNSITYSTNYQYAQMSRYRYQYDSTDYVRQMFNYTDDNLSIESKISVLSNWIFKKGKYTTFTFSNIYNQIGENETTIRTGINPTERPLDEFKNYSFHYTSRGIYFGQFEGNHRLRTKNERLIYTLGFSNVRRNEPDYRRFRTFRIAGSTGDYTLIDPPSSSLFDAARFYSKLNENTESINLNYENQILNFLDTNTNITFKAGAYIENKNRSFDARWISYNFSGNPALKSEFLRTPIDQIFAPENLNTTAGFKPLEGTNPSDRYDAANQLGAAYINSVIPYNIFEFNLGLRTEYFNQTLNSATYNGPVKVALTNLNLLPSVNIALYLDSAKSNTLLRLGYGRTVNRPEFRELAPFVYYDFMYDVNVVGNPDLQSAVIDNLDLRFEHYPNVGESFSLGLFYKNFTNPIENYVQPIGLSQQFTLKNAKSAKNYGVEIELRRDFKKHSQNRFLQHLSTMLNASYIYSSVDLGDDSTLSQSRTRPLQGQSPYIINAAFLYSSDSGWKINVAYNIIGKRIVYVGNNIFPTVYEMPRHSLDITFNKKITQRLSIKFGVSDVLNFKHQLWQDTNGDGKIEYNKERTDNQLLEFRRGQMFSLGLTFNVR
ncbi:MAG: outer membrane beta-barrel protein, partial [Bacteroidia bacterium]|nr:outer membrane beta-barrel protein [Bacteroidia bacterium]